jgi:DNA-binding IclR family transcriptional regulator
VARTDQPAVRLVGAVQRAHEVLDVLADEPKPLGTNEIARRTGINASSVSRLLATLVEGGLVERVSDSGRYRLGMRLLQLGSLVLDRLDLRRLAAPHLEALVAATGETATLSVPGERDAVTVDFVRSPASVQGVAQIGRPSVAHATATGKVLLAFGERPLPPATHLRAHTSRTIVQRTALAHELEAVLERGHAFNFGEREDDLHAVAAPVRGAGGRLVAILGVQGPASRLDRATLESVSVVLRTHAGELSRALGYDQG